MRHASQVLILVAGVVVTALLVAGLTPGAQAVSPSAHRADHTPARTPSRPTPQPARTDPGTTHLLDHASHLEGFNDQQWYESNIPFVDLPDKSVQDVYYYRWRVFKEHLRYTNPTDGWISTEFLDCCGYAAPYQAVDAAAGHQISEGRWLRDPSYLDDYVRFWLTGPGAGAKPATEAVNPDTVDWAHEYSFWLASAAYGRAEVTGDFSQLEQMLPQLVAQYRGWDKQFNRGLGLYWSVPVWDAMEFSASSYRSDDPYHGGAGYRPTMNSYQYGDAVAISRIATMAHDRKLSREYADRAARLKTSMQKWLWDPERKFYLAMARDDNPQHALLDTREEIGFVPWQFGAASPGDAEAWAQLGDPQGFASAYGPTTAERRSPLFMHEAGGCCRWDGPSWPFATAQTLTGLANLLDSGQAQSQVTKADYADALATYAKTQHKDGTPYVAEAHDPDQDSWIYDGQNHSEDYNHSTYNDLVLSGLLGLRPGSGDTLHLKPLVPRSWDHYAVENAPYHGHDVSVLWDRDGTHYHRGAGLRVFLDGRLVRTSPTLHDLTVRVPNRKTPASANGARKVNDAANPLREGYPKPIASYTWNSDDAWNALDGKVWFDEVPENTRWTNYSSPNAQDWYGVDFGVPTRVSDLRWYGYDDGGGVRPAAGYRVQYRTGAGWADVPGQRRAEDQPVGNGRNQVRFLPVRTTAVRLLLTNSPGAFVGVSELQAWSPSSRDAEVRVGPAVGADAPVTIDGTTPLDVTVTNAGSARLRDPRVGLAVPPGWTVRRDGRDTPSRIAPQGSATWRFLLTPAKDAEPGDVADVVARARYTGAHRQVLSTHARREVRSAFPAGQNRPVARWDLDEEAGASAVDSAGSHDLTLRGAPARVPGHSPSSGSALQLDGKTQSVESDAPVLDTRGSFSVSAWVRLDSTSSFATAVSQDGDQTSGFFLQYSQADGRFAFSTGEGRALADQAPETGRWYHLVGVHDANAGSYALYVDGKAQATLLEQAGGDVSNGPFAIGRAFSGGRPGDYWPGAIDQVSAWDRPLGAAEVAGLD